MDQVKATSSKMIETTKNVSKMCCKICNIWIDGKSMEQHLKGKKHISISNQIIMRKRKETEIASEGIYITGISPELSCETLVNHFKKFGHVVAFQRYHDKNSGLLQFGRKKEAKLALKAHHNIKGLSLNTEPRNAVKINTDFQVSPGISKQIENFKILFEKTLLANPMNSIDEQFRLLTAILEMTEVDKQQQSAIISSLQEWLSVEFPGCRLHLFGSSVSGLAFHGDSDLDIFFETPQTVEPENDVSGQSLTLANKLGSHQPKLEEKDALWILQRVSKVLRTHPDVSGLFVVSKARIPVSKFKHVSSGINCDLTCNNIIGVQNSKLLFALQKLDWRIRPFLYALKFWAKSQRLVGSPESTLSSYGLSLLAVFYLQRVEPPVLPTVESLQIEIPEKERIYCNGWNVSFRVPFRNEFASGSPSNKEASVFRLLTGFFQFYRQLIATEVVICPLMGKILPIDDFLRTFESVLDSPFKQGSLSVQDPFELNFNVTYNFRHYELFQSFCKSAETICLRIPSDVKNDSCTNLLSLFKTSPKKLHHMISAEHLMKSTINLTFELTDVASSVDYKKICQSVGQFIGTLLSFAYDVNISKNIDLKEKRQKTDKECAEEIMRDVLIMWKTEYILTFLLNVCYCKQDEMPCVNSGEGTQISIQSLLEEEKALVKLLAPESKLTIGQVENKRGSRMSHPFAVVNFLMNRDCSLPSISLEFKKSRETPVTNFKELVRNLGKCLSRSLSQFLVISKFPCKVVVKHI